MSLAAGQSVIDGSSATYDCSLVLRIDGTKSSKPIDAINIIARSESHYAHQLALVDHGCNNIFWTTQDLLVEPVTTQLLRIGV